MKPVSTASTLLLALLLVIGAAATAHAADKPAPAAPNAGWKKYTDKYKLQNWTTKPDSERFWKHSADSFTCMLVKGDWREGQKGRVEMAWSRWEDQEAEHMMEADVMFEKGTHGTCIMQIKTNESSGGGGNECIYIVVRDGTLFHGVSKKPILENGYDKWHNIKVAYNPADGNARVWINNELRFQHTYLSGLGARWYFKNGAYWASGTSKVHFKNLTFWVNPVKSSKEVFAANRAIVEKRAAEREAKKASGSSTDKKDPKKKR